MKPSYKMALRRTELHCPLVCAKCKKEIVIGERYMNRLHYETHEGCL